MRIVVSLLIALHFGSLVVAWGANPAPSFLQGELQGWLAPWHVSTGQDYIMLPLDLVHAEAMESPVWFQFREDGASNWQTLDLPGVERGEQGFLAEVLPIDYSGATSRWSNFARLFAWIAIEQPDSEVLPEFARQALKHLQNASNANLSSLGQVRFFQPHPMNFDEAAIADRGQASLIEEQLTGRTIYAAHVLRDAQGSIQLVPMEDAQRTATPAIAQVTQGDANPPSSNSQTEDQP